MWKIKQIIALFLEGFQCKTIHLFHFIYVKSDLFALVIYLYLYLLIQLSFYFLFWFMQFNRVGFEVSILLMGTPDSASKVIHVMEFIMLIRLLLNKGKKESFAMESFFSDNISLWRKYLNTGCNFQLGREKAKSGFCFR